MAIDRKYIDQFINVSSKAALGIFITWWVKKIKLQQIKAAVDSMRSELNKIDMSADCGYW